MFGSGFGLGGGFGLAFGGGFRLAFGLGFGALALRGRLGTAAIKGPNPDCSTSPASVPRTRSFEASFSIDAARRV